MKKIKAILCVFMLALLMTSSTKTTTIFVIGRRRSIFAVESAGSGRAN